MICINKAVNGVNMYGRHHELTVMAFETGLGPRPGMARQLGLTVHKNGRLDKIVNET